MLCILVFSITLYFIPFFFLIIIRKPDFAAWLIALGNERAFQLLRSRGIAVGMELSVSLPTVAIYHFLEHGRVLGAYYLLHVSTTLCVGGLRLAGSTISTSPEPSAEKNAISSFRILQTSVRSKSTPQTHPSVKASSCSVRLLPVFDNPVLTDYKARII